MRLLYRCGLSMLSCFPVLVFAQTNAHSDTTLTELIDSLLRLRPVVPTTLADAERATGMRFREEFHGTRAWVSDALMLRDGTVVDGIELRAYPPEDPQVRLITIGINQKTCISPAGVISRYGLNELMPPSPAPAPPAAGYPVSNGRITFHIGRYRRMPDLPVGPL